MGEIKTNRTSRPKASNVFNGGPPSAGHLRAAPRPLPGPAPPGPAHSRPSAPPTAGEAARPVPVTGPRPLGDFRPRIQGGGSVGGPGSDARRTLHFVERGAAKCVSCRET